MLERPNVGSIEQRICCQAWLSDWVFAGFLLLQRLFWLHVKALRAQLPGV